jgi:hypothetical protein
MRAMLERLEVREAAQAVTIAEQASQIAAFQLASDNGESTTTSTINQPHDQLVFDDGASTTTLNINQPEFHTSASE